MRTRVAEILALAIGAIAAVLVLTPDRDSPRAAEPAPAVSWQGLVGDGPRAPVHIGQQMIVVLEAPSLAERVAAHGGVATTKQEQKWSSSVLSQIRLLRSRLEVQGVTVHPDLLFTHVLSGFSSALDATAISLLERDSGRAGRVSRPRRVSGVGFVGCARAPRARVVGRQRRPVRWPATTAAPSRSPSSTPASIACIPRRLAASRAGSTSWIRAATRLRRPRPGGPATSSGTAPSSPAFSSRPRPARGPRRRSWRERAPDSYRRLAARRQRPVRGLFAHGTS
jgi:hypothetical protein